MRSYGGQSLPTLVLVSQSHPSLIVKQSRSSSEVNPVDGPDEDDCLASTVRVARLPF